MTSTLGIKKIQHPNGTNIATLDSSGSIAFAGASTVAGTLGVTGAITGTLATAAQTNITSLGTLSFVTVNGTGTSNFTSTATSPVQINGTSIPTLTVRNSTTPVELQMRATTSEGLVRTSTNHPLAFAVNASEKMRINASGNVGIGTASPNFMLDIVGSSQNLLELTSGGSFGSAIVIDQNTNSDSISISSSGTGSPIVSNSAGASNIIAKSTNGNGGYLNYTGLSSGGTTTFSVTHNGKVYAADGINLGGTGTANHLDDYEEGTWTANLIGSSANPSSAVTVTGYYTKIGQMVYVNAQFNNFNNSGASGGLRVNGLPFTPSPGNQASGNIMVQSAATWGGSNTANISPYFQTSYIGFYASQAGGGWFEVSHNTTAAGYLSISGTYKV